MKAIILGLCLISFTAKGQELKDTGNLEPVEVKATRAGTNAPFAKTNLTYKEISHQNLGQDLPFLLNQTPSVVVNSDAGNGVGYTGIRIRGTDASRINVTLNGIPYNDAESQGTFFVDLPDFASSLKSIQVQRGVGTSSNGGGAFGATINLSTNDVNRIPYLQVNNSYGSFQTLKNTISAGSGIYNNHFTTDIRLSRISSNGYIDRASSHLRSFYFSNAFLSDKTDVRLNVFSGSEKTYQAWYGVSQDDLTSHRRVNYAGTEKPGEPYDNETDNYRQDHYQLFLTGRWHPRLTTSAAIFFTNGLGYYEQYKASQDYASYGIQYPVIGADTIFNTDLVRRLWLDNNFYGTVYSLLYNYKKTRLTVGGAITHYDGNHDGKIVWMEKSNASNQKYYNVDARKNDASIYGKWQQHLNPDLDSYIEAQARNVLYVINGFQENPSILLEKKYLFINPKAGFSYHKNQWLAFASWSRGTKEPNRDDFETGINQVPVPERLDDFEAGVESRKNRFTWSINFYYMYYHNQLVLTGKINDVGAYTRTNIPESYRLGTEGQVSATLNKWLSASANITISRNKISGFTEYIDDYDNGGQKTKQYSTTDISFSPSVISAANITITPVRSFQIIMSGKYVGRQYLDNTSDDSRKLDAWFTQDARIVYTYSGKHLKNVEVIFQAFNLSNAMYEPNGYTFSYYNNNQLTTSNYYFPMAGRNFMMGVNFRL